MSSPVLIVSEKLLKTGLGVPTSSTYPQNSEFCSGVRSYVSSQVFYTCMDVASEFLVFFPNFLGQTSRSGLKKRGGPGSLGPRSPPGLLLLSKKISLLCDTTRVRWMLIIFLTMQKKMIWENHLKEMIFYVKIVVPL